MYIFVLSVIRVLLDLFLKGIIKWRNKYVEYNLILWRINVIYVN